ncbi:MAG TPA: glycosyltransferase [Vicinamibacterales bacterium]|nr:glycosyltransferase [Vicinamibacterales bacterium]
MKIALVVQRYGADINGGAELHARYIAEHLARHVEVEVLTTCASDYITWRNERAEGLETVLGVAVRRFPVSRERDPREFADWSQRIFKRPHSVRDELAWLEAEGPASPALVQYIEANQAAYDFFVFFSVRYYHAYHGARTVPGKAILVPTAERDAALGLGIFGPIFRGVRALMYNSFEERALIQAVSKNDSVPGVVVGVGSQIPERTEPGRFRQKFELSHRFAVYVGRIDENKGCRELFDFFENYSASLVDGLHLVLIGTPVIAIPRHPRIHHLGFVSDQDKFDAIAASEVLIMPSYFESLSMVALEAWALGRPVLANAACDVLQGQCVRSNAGLFYSGFHEFFEALRTLDGNPALAASLGRNGRQYFERHYSWPVVERKYTDMFDRLRREPAPQPMEPLPGWWARRRPALEAAETVVAGLPKGPVSGAAVERATLRPAADQQQPSVGRAPADRPAPDREPAAGRQTDRRDGGGNRRPGAARHGRGPAPARDSQRPGNRRPAPDKAATPPAQRAPSPEGAPKPSEGGARRRPMRGRRRPGERR